MLEAVPNVQFGFVFRHMVALIWNCCMYEKNSSSSNTNTVQSCIDKATARSCSHVCCFCSENNKQQIFTCWFSASILPNNKKSPFGAALVEVHIHW